MAHFTRTQTDGTWNNSGVGNYITLISDWTDLGAKAAKAVNGDEGGAWAPTSPIAIDTAGMAVSGPAVVDYNGVLQGNTNTSFALNANDYPALAPGHYGNKRSLLSDLSTYQCTPRFAFLDSPDYVGAIQSIAGTVLAPFQPGAILNNAATHIDLRVHDNARLTDGEITLRVPTLRYQLPVTMPRFRVMRVDTSGNIQSLRAESSDVDANGFSEVTRPASGVAWFNGGDAQHFAFTCDQHQTIDTSRFTYHLEFVDEQGTLDPSFVPSTADGASVRVRKTDVVYTFAAITFFPDNTGAPVAQLGPYGRPTGAAAFVNDGDTVLYDLPQTGTTSDLLRGMNGLWIVRFGGAWERSPDALNPSDLVPYFLVYDTNLRRFFEYTGPFAPAGSLHRTFYGSAAPGQQVTSLTTFPYNFSDVIMNFQVRRPRGVILHAVLLNFDSIFDMRPQ